MESTMDITIRVPSNADNALIAAALRMRAGLFEGQTAKEAASRKNTDAKVEPEKTTKPVLEKKTKTKLAPEPEESFDLEAGEEGEIVDEDSFEISEDETPEKTITKEDVIKALQALVKKHDGNRDKAIGIVKKFAKSGAVKDIKVEDYPRVMKALGA
jgi:hypothetical protein